MIKIKHERNQDKAIVGLVIGLILVLIVAGYNWEQQKIAPEITVDYLLNEARKAEPEDGLLACEKGDYYMTLKGQQRHCRDLKGTKQRAEWVARINQLNADAKAKRETKRAWEQLNFCISNLELCLAGNQTACRIYCKGPVGSDSCEESFRPQPFC